LRGKGNAPLDVRRGTLRTELVKSPDGRGYQLVGSPVQKFASVPGIVARARERKKLLEREAEFLRSFLIKTIARETYLEWLSSSGLAIFFCEDDWTNKDNHRKFALFGLACFVDFFRPGQIDWRTPNVNDMQLMTKLLKIFADSTNLDQQRKLVRGLFDLEQDLKSVVVETSTGLSRKDRELLLECHRLRLKGEKRARWLREHEFQGFEKSPLTKYREHPDSMRAQLSTWTRQVLDD